ncbi:MAG: hypothetical protein OXE99_00165 [Cellvibrionales bacterium]|nr:hypothetical protein [Cellvibrionales bacterium]
MASVIKDFTVKIAVGIRGYSLLAISETLSEHSCTQGTDISPSLILHDIDQTGIEEWIENSFIYNPASEGIYFITGTARFDEDEAEYSVESWLKA